MCSIDLQPQTRNGKTLQPLLHRVSNPFATKIWGQQGQVEQTFHQFFLVIYVYGSKIDVCKHKKWCQCCKEEIDRQANQRVCCVEDTPHVLSCGRVTPVRQSEPEDTLWIKICLECIETILYDSRLKRINSPKWQKCPPSMLPQCCSHWWPRYAWIAESLNFLHESHKAFI